MMVSVVVDGGFNGWRDLSRSLLEKGVPPEEVMWNGASLFGGMLDNLPPAAPVPMAKVPAAFLKLASEVSCHADDGRWAILYRLLWRFTRGGEKHLLEISSDPDVVRAATMAKNVRREIHKMHAFVRFKLISTDEATGRERYAAWFEPDHHIVQAAAPFFRARFANMDWSIFTPKGCVHWIDETFSHSPGIPANPVGDADALESAWSTYYRSIFNPARLKTKMMQTEMPKRYWKNLPEASQIPGLIAASRPRVDHMLEKEPSREKQAPALPYLAKLRNLEAAPPVESVPAVTASLEDLRRLASHCRACPLWADATCTVFGNGPADARLMIVGEQPGDKEDIAGLAFVGPAGKVLDRALAEAGIDRQAAYVTNAVKHFKWTPSGKIRLHQKPDATEIDACRPWLLGELGHIKPEVLLLLGSTAARAVTGKNMAVTKFRGLLPSTIAPRVILTVHPSSLLRIPDALKRESEYRRFVEDLRLARV
jgi:probable DNA metabolism protein